MNHMSGTDQKCRRKKLRLSVATMHTGSRAPPKRRGLGQTVSRISAKQGIKAMSRRGSSAGQGGPLKWASVPSCSLQLLCRFIIILKLEPRGFVVAVIVVVVVVAVV